MIAEYEHTSKFGTNTRQGFIYHLKTEEGIRLPVKLDFNSEKIENTYFPLRKDGKLVFALPGGGEILESQKL
jgi:hypothetical protein